MKYLFVVAHPDDEILGGGATINRLSSRGDQVYVCVMNSQSEIRSVDSERMRHEMLNTHQALGVCGSYTGNFETLNFNNVPHMELVQFIEDSIRNVKPDVIITHHPSDLHNDHQMVSIACQVAARLPQRQISDENAIKAFYFMEVPSSTDWGFSSTNDGFKPTTYIEVKYEDLQLKLSTLGTYTDGQVIRDAPHPRSGEAIEALAIKRGSEIGCEYAEAFQLVFQKI